MHVRRGYSAPKKRLDRTPDPDITENSKLSTTQVRHYSGMTFAQALEHEHKMLERAIERSKAPQPALIEAQPLPTTELKRPFSRLVRRF